MLSILIPVYNEVSTIVSLLRQIEGLDIDKEIIIVDDFSTDGTRELLKERFGDGDERIKIIYHDRNLGKGAAVRRALEYAAGYYTIIQDADLEYDPKDYKVLLKRVSSERAEAVYGSRFLKTWRATSLWHFIVNNFFTLITNLLYGSRLTDMGTCYKLLKTEVFKGLDIRSTRFEIDAEITARLLKKGHKIIEVPVSYKGRSYREGKKIMLKDGFVILLILLKHRFIR